MAENFLIRDSGLVGCQPYWIGSQTTDLTGIAANGNIAEIRNIGNEPLVISKIVMSFFTKTQFTAAQHLAFGVFRVVGMTALAAGGVDIFGDGGGGGDKRKRRAEFLNLASTAVNPAEFEGTIATTAALTGSTGTSGGRSPIDVLHCGCDVVGTAGLSSGRSEWTPGNRVPLALQPNEGLRFFNLFAWGAGGVGQFFIGVDAHKS